MLKYILFQAAVALLQHLTTLKKEDFEWAVKAVTEAEDSPELPTGEERRKHVLKRVEKVFKGIVPFARDLLVSLAVGYAQKAGLIDVRDRRVKFTEENL